MIKKKYLKKIGLFLSIIVILSFFTLSKSSTQQPCEITVLGTGQYGPNGLFVTVRNNDDDQNVTLCIEWRCTCGMESCPLPSGYTCKTFFIEKGQMTSITFPIQHIPPCEEGCSGHIVTYLNVSCEKIPNEPPQAILEVQPSEGEAPLQIHIKTSGEDDEKVVKYQLILKYKTKEMANIIREKPITISRVLKEAGEYKITLTVWDEEGEMDSVTETVEVRVPPEEPPETVEVTPTPEPEEVTPTPETEEPKIPWKYVIPGIAIIGAGAAGVFYGLKKRKKKKKPKIVKEYPPIPTEIVELSLKGEPTIPRIPLTYPPIDRLSCDEVRKKLEEMRREYDELEREKARQGIKGKSLSQLERELENAKRERENAKKKLAGSERNRKKAENEYQKTIKDQNEKKNKLENLEREKERMKAEVDKYLEQHGISTTPRDGWREIGIGRGDWIEVRSVWVRDLDEDWRNLGRVLRDGYKKWKQLKKEIEQSESKLKEAEKARGAAENELNEARNKFNDADKKVRELEEALEKAKTNLDLGAENEKLEDYLKELERKLEECEKMKKDCIKELEGLKEQFENLKSEYENCIKTPGNLQNEIFNLNCKQLWKNWWKSFKELRETVKHIMGAKSLTQAKIPEFQGLWDWGGSVGTAVGYGAEDIVSAPIPTDVIKVVGGMYGLFKALLDPNTDAGGQSLLKGGIKIEDLGAIQKAFNDFPAVLKNALETYKNHLFEMKKREEKAKELLSQFKKCVESLPDSEPFEKATPQTLEECEREKQRLHQHIEKMKGLLERCKRCKPDDVEETLRALNNDKTKIQNSISKMKTTNENLEKYRKAMSRYFSESTGGLCFISTAVYGNSLSCELETLRQFRDNFMLQNKMGYKMVQYYYKISPKIAEKIARNEESKLILREIISKSLYFIRKGEESENSVLKLCYNLIAVGFYIYGILVAKIMVKKIRF